MPTFDTPEPITATIDVAVGDVEISAGDGAETVVDVRPSDASNREDVDAAAATRVEYTNRHLLIKAPKPPWLSKRGGRIDVTIELPAGSSVRGTGQLTDFRSDGALGECRIKTGVGQIRLDRADASTLKTGIGDISVEHATGHTEITTGTGEVRVRELDASAVIKNSHGDSWIGLAGGDVRLTAAHGSIAVDRARGSIVAKSSIGDIRLGEVAGGSVVLETRLGDLEVGIPAGTAAWLDASAKVGHVHNMLDTSDAPGASDATVAVRARTAVGEIAVRRPAAVATPS
jgi:DUF4097 and DUF4098 domain-containing protein YvlB